MLRQGDIKEKFSTGAQRDTQCNKSRPDLISPIFLDRLGVLLAEGAKHYGERNWEKGMPLSRLLASAMRHMIQTLDGQEDEDHPIQCAFNLMAYVHTKTKIIAGELPAELDDLSRKSPPTGRGADEIQCRTCNGWFSMYDTDREYSDMFICGFCCNPCEED